MLQSPEIFGWLFSKWGAELLFANPGGATAGRTIPLASTGKGRNGIAPRGGKGIPPINEWKPLGSGGCLTVSFSKRSWRPLFETTQGSNPKIKSTKHAIN